MHAPAKGTYRPVAKIGDLVGENQIVAYVDTEDGQSIPVITTISGKVRGMLHAGLYVPEGFKVADAP